MCLQGSSGGAQVAGSGGRRWRKARRKYVEPAAGRQRSSVGAVLQQSGGQASSSWSRALDQADAVDLFCEQEDSEGEEHLPPEEAALAAEMEAEQPSEEAEPAGPGIAAACCSWWQRVGDLLPSGALSIGGAPVHSSHTLACFGNEAHIMVLCTQCGGMTHGTFAPLLAECCRRKAGDTMQRQVARVMVKQVWPTGALQQQFGLGSVSAEIRFAEVGPGIVQIRAASAVHGGGGNCA